MMHRVIDFALLVDKTPEYSQLWYGKRPFPKLGVLRERGDVQEGVRRHRRGREIVGVQKDGDKSLIYKDLLEPV
jgi:hypothetical protein